MTNPELDLHNTQATVAMLDSFYESMGLEQSLEFKIFKKQEEHGEGLEAVERYLQNPTPENRTEIGKELCDDIFCALNILNHFGIDANEAMNQTLQKNLRRINPETVEMVRQETGLTGRELYKECKRRGDGAN